MRRSVATGMVLFALVAVVTGYKSVQNAKTTPVKVEKFVETYEFAAKSTTNPPGMILFASVSPQWYMHKVDYLAGIGVKGVMIRHLVESWEDDIWALPTRYVPDAPEGRVVGAGNPQFKLCKRLNEVCASKGITENSVELAYYSRVPDWFDDAAWAKATETFRQTGIFAKGAGFKGITLDIEYINEMYNLDWAGYDTLAQYTRRPDAEMLAKAEQRGYEIMNGMLDGFPEMVHWHLPESLLGYGPIGKAHVKGLIRAMAEQDAPGGFHISIENTYLTTSPKGILSAYAEVAGALRKELNPELMKYWNKRCSINIGMWPLGYYKDIRDEDGRLIGYTGKEETFHGANVGSKADKSHNYSVDDFRNQLGTVTAFGTPYFWLFIHGQVLWQMTPDEMKQYHGFPSDTLIVEKNLEGYLGVMRQASPIATQYILDGIAVVKKGERPSYVGVTPAWQVSGVYPAENPEMYRTAYAPETGGAGVTWKTVRPEGDGLIDLRKHVDKRDFFAAYGTADFELDEDAKLVFRFGSNDWGTVFLDGVKLFEYAEEGGRTAGPDQDNFIVNVKKGRHTVLIKCGDIGGAAWWYFFRITDVHGNASEGVKWLAM